MTWTIDGLEMERFTLRFPFSWRKRRKLFDRYVAIQRQASLTRRVPDAISPHLGSQWWCLTRATLEAILTAPDRAEMDRYFRQVWIPDEAYFQTLARRHAERIESRSLTLSKFDIQGKPHIFYDDHLQLLERSDCFVARKIWPRAELLYQAFLDQPAEGRPTKEPNPAKIDRLFSRANIRRAEGRPGLVSQGRMPAPHWDGLRTCAAYSVYGGFDDLYDDFPDWLSRRVGGAHPRPPVPPRPGRVRGRRDGGQRLHPRQRRAAGLPARPVSDQSALGHAGANGRISYSGRATSRRSAISSDAIRTRGSRWSSGAWAVRLYRSNRPFSELRADAARLQKAELAFSRELRAASTKAQVTTYTLADYLENPMERLQRIVEDMNGRDPRRLTEAPDLPDLTGLGDFLQEMRNQGLKPVTTGDIPADPGGAS